MKIYDINSHSNWFDDITQCKMLGRTEADFEVGIHSVIKLKNKYYRIGLIDVKNEYCGVRKCKKFDITNEETSFKHLLTCPICGFEDNDSFELSDNDDEYQCACGAVLEIERDYEITYSAKVVQLPKIYE